jgi:hypothetical protein
LGRQKLDSSVDRVPILHDGLDDRAGQVAGRRVGLRLGQLPLEDGSCGPLAELGLEYGRQRDASAGPPRPDPIGGVGVALLAHVAAFSRRRHRSRP